MKRPPLTKSLGQAKHAGYQNEQLQVLRGRYSAIHTEEGWEMLMSSLSVRGRSHYRQDPAALSRFLMWFSQHPTSKTELLIRLTLLGFGIYIFSPLPFCVATVSRTLKPVQTQLAVKICTTGCKVLSHVQYQQNYWIPKESRAAKCM